MVAKMDKLRVVLSTIYSFSRIQPYSLANLSLGTALYHSKQNDQLDIRMLSFNDTTITPKCIAEGIVKYNPDVICLGIYTWNENLLIEAVPLLRRKLPEAIIIAGGLSVLDGDEHFSRHFLEVDFFVRGEGELALCKIIDAIINSDDLSNLYQRCESIYGVSTTESYGRKYKERITVPLFEIHSPYHMKNSEPSFYDKIGGCYDYVWAEFSRGCRFDCAFCAFDAQKVGFRALPMSRITHDLECFSEHGVKHLYVTDPIFGGKKSHAIAVLEQLAARPLSYQDGDINRPTFIHAFFRAEYIDQTFALLLAKSRISMVQIGLQTINPNVDIAMRRNNIPLIIKNIPYLHRYKVPFQLDLIIGFPGDNLTGFRESLRFVIEVCRPLTFRAHLLSVIQNTSLARMALEQGTKWLRFESRSGNVVESLSYSANELNNMLVYANLCVALYNYLNNHEWLNNESLYRKIGFFDHIFACVKTWQNSEREKLLYEGQKEHKMVIVNRLLNELGYCTPVEIVEPKFYGELVE